MTPPKHHRNESRKRNFKDTMKSCLSTQTGNEHFEACYTCQVDCAIARKADIEHWANEENNTPRYSGIADCPKAENINRLDHKKSMRKLRGK